MRTTRYLYLFAFLLLLSVVSIAQATQSSADELGPGSPHVLTPDGLLKIIQSPSGEQPLILNVGPWMLYRQAHIPEAVFVGPAADQQSTRRLHALVKEVAHNKAIVLYCGCCPWGNCPNVRPAFKELSTMGFTNVKVLYIADNFGADWVGKGYPTIKGQ